MLPMEEGETRQWIECHIACDMIDATMEITTEMIEEVTRVINPNLQSEPVTLSPKLLQSLCLAQQNSHLPRQQSTFTHTYTAGDGICGHGELTINWEQLCTMFSCAVACHTHYQQGNNHIWTATVNPSCHV